MKEGYPLEPLVAVRHSRVEQRAEALAQARRRVAEGVERVAVAERALAEHHQRVRSEQLRAEGRLASGVARAQDLQQLADYRRSAELAQADLEDKLEALRAELKGLETECQQAQRELARAEAESQVLERHHQDWEREQERRDELRLEEEVQDQHQGRQA